jgi:hypothetical protein
VSHEFEQYEGSDCVCGLIRNNVVHRVVATAVTAQEAQHYLDRKEPRGDWSIDDLAHTVVELHHQWDTFSRGMEQILKAEQAKVARVTMLLHDTRRRQRFDVGVSDLSAALTDQPEQCPTPCDPDCDLICHELHESSFKREPGHEGHAKPGDQSHQGAET